jgi:hypothetical protein
VLVSPGTPTEKSRFEHPRYLKDLRKSEKLSLQTNRDPDTILNRNTDSQSCSADTILSLCLDRKVFIRSVEFKGAGGQGVWLDEVGLEMVWAERSGQVPE